MNIKITLFSMLLTLVLSSQAQAVKLLVNMTPPLAEGPMTFTMKSLEGGKTRFTITRDPSAANQPTNPDLTLDRGARLAVYGDQGPIVSCPVATRENRSGHFVYQFELDDELAKTSRFTLSEIEDYKKDGPGYIGGGTIYEFALIDFIEPGHQQRQFQKELEAAVKQSEQELKQLTEKLREEGLPE